MTLRRTGGFTWVEASIGIIVLVVLFFLAQPSINSRSKKDRMQHMLSNMKQLHLATSQMALDGLTTGDTNLGWPGDTGGTFSHWAQTLTKEGYLSTNDLCTLLVMRGKTVQPNRIPPMKDCAFFVYAVREESPADTVFLSTKNFTNLPAGSSQGEALKKMGREGFLVFRKGGMGGIVIAPHKNTTSSMGTFAPLCQ